MPFGYICGFPVGGISSELYGYYAGQLAMQSQQGSAVKDAVSTWSIEHGQTELDLPVCKSSYRPYDPATGKRMYGCPRHHPMRLERLIKAQWAPRPGWAAFDQWEPKQTTKPKEAPRREEADDSGDGDDCAAAEEEEVEEEKLDATPEVPEAAAAAVAVEEEELCCTPPLDRGKASAASMSSSRIA